MSINEKMTAIADKIRGYTGKTDKLSLDGIADEIDAVNSAGFASGRDMGYTDGIAQGTTEGKAEQKKAFWNAYQNYGNRTLYQYAFWDIYWNDTTYDPLYPIVSNNCNYVFQSSGITDTKVTIDFSGATGQMYNAFNNCTNLKTIRKLIVNGGLYFNSFFVSCSKLENITIEGTIGNGFDIHWSPLTEESIESVVSALSDTVTGKTVTFKKAAVEAAFTDEERAALVASKPNWTISLV